MSKGSTPRPRQVSREEYERRWAETFGGRKRREYTPREILDRPWRLPVFDGYITNDGDRPIEINGRTIAAGERVRVL